MGEKRIHCECCSGGMETGVEGHGMREYLDCHGLPDWRTKYSQAMAVAEELAEALRDAKAQWGDEYLWYKHGLSGPLDNFDALVKESNGG